MKENVFDVLMYLFENYMDEGAEFHPDQETLTTELTEAGFPRGEIHKAFHWLEGLSAVRASETTLPLDFYKEILKDTTQGKDILTGRTVSFTEDLKMAARESLVIEL